MYNLSQDQIDRVTFKILLGLQSQRFADWYNKGNFDAYISSDDNAPTVETIKSDIQRLFTLGKP